MEDITPPDSAVPIYLVPLTTEELAEREQLVQEEQARQTDVIAEEKLKQEARASALAKLKKLGLTEEEAKAVIGL
jgi:hypothetical protein